ncbi:hypothetical protein CI610_01271 [invertebrate metagenome]|uniref:Uncharacterized protein n=1 Tax=invertebrate metagenome TaxID=1711999 RepID=A0A2H9T997_9ZZZZ
MVAHQTIFSGEANNSLFNKVVTFNSCPADYIHESWFKHIQYGELISSLRDSHDAQPFLSEHLLAILSLQKEWDYAFELSEKRIALDDSEILIRLPLYIGIVLNETVIRKAIKRSDRLALEATLGKEAYLFAVKKAQFLFRHRQDNAQASIDWDHIDRFKNFIILSGLQVMAVVYGEMPKAFCERLYIKLPVAWKKHLSKKVGLSLSKQDCLNLLTKTYKEVNRQWHHLLS